MTTEPYDLIPEFAAVADDLEVDGATFEERAEAAFAAINFDDEPSFDDEVRQMIQWSERCDQLLRYHRNLDARKAALVAEMDRLKAKFNAVENRREEVRNYLRSVMVLMGTKRVKTTIATASISAGRERIVLDDANMCEHVKLWPPEVVAAAVTYPPKIDKTALKEIEPITVLAALPGVSIECGEDVLTIR